MNKIKIVFVYVMVLSAVLFVGGAVYALEGGWYTDNPQAGNRNNLVTYASQGATLKKLVADRFSEISQITTWC